MASVQKVRLMSSDGVSFEMDVDAAQKSQLLKFMMEDTNYGEDVIPIPNVTANILSKVIEYCNKHVHGDDVHKEWDSEFVKVDQATLYGLLMAANYLDIKSLLELICQTVADMIKGKTPEEIREIFNIKNDFTPQEEEELRKEYQWAFEI